MIRAILAISLMSALLLIGGGCAKSASMKSWQGGVEQYVKDNGNDPLVLRSVTLDNSRAGFAVIGALDPRKATDARALLLSHKSIAGRACFIYLVGIVKKQNVQDIRVAVVSFNAGQAAWRIGHKDSKALKTYREGGLAMWHERSTDRKVPPAYTTFPRESDLFDLIVNGTLVEAKHAQTGAVFSIDLSESAPAKK